MMMPALFLGHGNPMNALEQNEFTRAWQRLGRDLPRPRAILAVSAHWYVPGLRVTAAERPRTIHDFGGFPAELYGVQYPAAGSAELVARVRELMGPALITPDASWGLDHGAWSVLVHLYPQADVPVVQLSLDETATAVDHLVIAQRLRPLRREGVLILGSGNVVHNLHTYAWRRAAVEPYEWAVRFETTVRQMLEQRDLDGIAGYETLGKDAVLAAPTPDHFLPLLYVAAQALPDDPVTFPVEGFDGGSVSMLAARVG